MFTSESSHGRRGASAPTCAPSPGASSTSSGRPQRFGILTVPPGNRLEKLRGRLAGYYSIRVNDQFRIVFKFQAGQTSHVQLVDHH
jgi:predicted Zn-dependent protease